MASPATSPWHAGERTVQERVGERQFAERANGAIRDAVPTAGVEFLAEQPMIVVAAVDGEGRTWVSPLHGEPGFLTVPRPDVLHIGARPADDDPLASVLDATASIGTIAIEPATRRRIRLNGTALPDRSGLYVQLDQVYANCPKYIQRRELDIDGDARRPGPPLVGEGLTVPQQRWIAETDTLFIGTSDASGNVDASHRGGNPGFVAVGERRLRFPDYRGNSFYMSLGNLEENPAIGMLLVDWATGSTLQLTGRAVVHYEREPGDEWPDGALRMIDVDIDAVVERAAALPLRAGDVERSRFNPPIHTPA